MESGAELYINGRNLLSAEFEAETRRFAESLAHPIINGIMDHARDQEPREESDAPRESDSVDMQTTSKQEDRKDIRNYVKAFVEEMSGMKKKPQQELLFRTYFTGLMEHINKDNTKEEHSEVERVNLVNRETGVCNGPFPIADPMPFFQYRALMEGSCLKELTHAPIILTKSVLKTMMLMVSGMLEDEFDAIFGYTPTTSPIKGATEEQMDDYEAAVALETAQHWKQFDLFLREHSDTSNGLLLVLCTVVRHIRAYALKNRLRAIEILEFMLSYNPFVHQFFGGRSAVRLQRFVPRAVINSLRISVDDNQVRHQGFMLFEREFIKDPLSFCFPASYAREVCKAGHALNLTGRECIPLDVVVETIVAYGLNGPELAPNYQLLAVLIYTITQVAVERDNHTIVTYEYVLNMINNWMASPALHPRTNDITPFHYGEMRDKKVPSETHQHEHDDQWPIQEQWFSACPRNHIYEALRYACSDDAGRSLVCIYEERLTMLDGDLDSIDSSKLRIAWDVMYKLDSILLYCAYKMYERLLKRQREKRPLEMKRIPLDGMCSEQLFLLSCALGYRVEGEHSYPIAPFIALAGMAGSGKTQGLEPIMKILGPRRFLIVSKQHNQKGGILRRFPEARVTTSLMFLHRHQFQCVHTDLEPYHLTTAAELENRRSVLQHMRIRQDDRILNEVFHALQTQTRLPASINEFDYPNPGCIYSEVVGVYAEEFPLTEFQTGAIFLYNLVACSKVEFIIFAGDLNQLPIVSGGNFYRALTNAFYTVMFHHPHRAVAPELTRLYEGVIQGDTRVNFDTPLSRAVPYGDDAPKRSTSQDLRDIMVRQCIDIMKLQHLTYHNTQFIAYANNICEWDLGHRFGYMLRHQLEVCPKMPPRFDAGQKVQPLTTDPELRLYKRVVYIVCCVLHVDVKLPDRKSQVTKEKGLSEQARMLCIQAAVQARAQQMDVRFGEMLTAVCVNPTVASVMRSCIPPQAPFLEMHRSATDSAQTTTAMRCGLPRECFLEHPHARGKIEVPLVLSERAQYLALKELSLPTRISGATFTVRNIVANSNVACNRGVKFVVLRVFRGARDLEQPPEEQDVVLMPITRRPMLTDATCLTIHSAQGLEFEHVVVVVNPWSRMNRQALYSALTRVICPRKWQEMSDEERKVLFVLARSEDMANIMRSAPVRPYGVTGSALAKVRAYAENVLGYRVHFNYLECALLEKHENGRFGARPTPFMKSLREERADLSDSEFELWVEQQAALFSKHLPAAAVAQVASDVGSKRKREESDSSCSTRKEATLMDRYLSSK